MKMPLVIAIFAMSVGAVRADEPLQIIAAAARSSSDFTLSTIKRAAQHRPSPRMDGECVAQIDNLSLATEFQHLLEEHFTSAERDELNAFYSSSAGGKYRQDALQTIQAQRFGINHPPVEFTSEESAQVRAYQSSSTGKKYVRIVSLTSPEWKTIVGPAFSKLLSGCQKR
jgi:hypothetical protein